MYTHVFTRKKSFFFFQNTQKKLVYIHTHPPRPPDSREKCLKMTGSVTAGGWNCSGEKIRKTHRLLQYVPGIHVFPDRQKKINYKTGRNTGPTGCARAYLSDVSRILA